MLFQFDIGNAASKMKERETAKKHDIYLNHVVTEILRHQFFRKSDFPITKYDCLLDVCDNLIKDSRKRQEKEFLKTPYENAYRMKDKVDIDNCLVWLEMV